MYLAELPWRRGCSAKEGSSVFSLFSLIKLHLASLPLASSYSRVAASSVFCAPWGTGPTRLGRKIYIFWARNTDETATRL